MTGGIETITATRRIFQANTADPDVVGFDASQSNIDLGKADEFPVSDGTLASPTGADRAAGPAFGTIVGDDAASLSVGGATVDYTVDSNWNTGFTGVVSVAAGNAALNGWTIEFNASFNIVSIWNAEIVSHTGNHYVIRNVAYNGDLASHQAASFGFQAVPGGGGTTATGFTINGVPSDHPTADLPTISIADASVLEGNPAGPGGETGWLSTRGNQIVDAHGDSVKIAGVNWFGFEGENQSPNGLWTRGYKEMMQQMEDLGFNTIRLPYSSDMLHTASAALGIHYSKNPDLVGLTPLQVMDKIVAYADQIGLKIILDHHRSDPGAGASSNGLWYDSSHSQAAWINDWQMLAQRYASDHSVIGADLHNEPYNGTWGGGGANDWAAAAEAAGNAIGAVNPNWLIFVEGVASYQGSNYWWGGNLEGVRDRPIELDIGNKLVYSAHDYPNSVYAQPWFQSPNFAAQLPAVFDKAWGYIYREGIAPVYVGEFGSRLVDPKDAPWLEALTSYMSGDFDNNGTIDIPAGKQGISWTYWSWNPNSRDTGGILQDDWSTVNENKMAYLEPIEFDFPGSGGGGGDHHVMSFAVSLSAAATEAVTVGYHTMTGEATASDFTAVSGTLTFAVGERSKTVQVPITADALREGNEHFLVILTDAHGAVIGSATATGTIIDDDALFGGSGNDHLTGGTGDDTIYGNAGNDTLDGGAGNDVLVGGAGTDALIGGAGIDTAHFAQAPGAVTLSLAAGSGSGGEASGDRFTGIENVVGSAFDDVIAGDAGANGLSGLAGADRLYGGLGDDTVNGGDGNDTLYGQDGVDRLNGGEGNDGLVGGAGADLLSGGNGIDAVLYDASAAAVTVNLLTGRGAGGDATGDSYSGIENVVGSALGDTITGNAVANSLWGMAGNDVLAGGGGADALKGGAGADRFVYQAIADSTVAAAGRDSINDFSHAEGDRMDLSAIDADGNTGNGNTAFTFLGGGAFTGAGHEVRVVVNGGIQMVLADLNGDKAADLQINVVSATALVAADFVL
jgi:aryl-phospho-beta-D-glucosidase BglC (GH1 family)